MVVYNINIEDFSASNGYSKGNLIIYDGLIYQANHDIVAGDWNPSDWSNVTDTQKVTGTKFIVDFLNIVSDEKPDNKIITDNNEYTCFCKDNITNQYQLWKTTNRGQNWILEPIESYNNLTVYCKANDESYFYKAPNHLMTNLNKLQMGDLVNTIVFYNTTLDVPVTNPDFTYCLDFGNFQLELSRAPTDNFKLKYRDTLANTSKILIDNNNTAINQFEDGNIDWFVGERTITFKRKTVLVGFINNVGISNTNSFSAGIGNFDIWRNYWIKNKTVKTAVFDVNGHYLDNIDYDNFELVHSALLGSNIIEPVNGELDIPYADTASHQDGIIKYNSPGVTITNGVISLNTTNVNTVYGTYDFGFNTHEPPADMWVNLGTEGKLKPGMKLVRFDTNKVYEWAAGHGWGEIGSITMVEKQCCFVDNYFELDDDEDLAMFSSVIWKQPDGIKELLGKPLFDSRRTVVNEFNKVSKIDNFSIVNLLVDLDNPIDDVENISNIHIKGTLSFRTVVQDANENDPNHYEVFDIDLPFNAHSMHSQIVFKENETNVRKLFYGLSNKNINEGLNISSHVLDQFYFFAEPTGYVKSIVTAKDYVPFYLPVESQTDSLVKGIQLSTDPPEGVGNVHLYWDFGTIPEEITRFSLGPNTGKADEISMQVNGHIIVTYSY